MTSPSVRASFARRRRRVAAAVGKTGVVGVTVVGVPVGVGVPGSLSGVPGNEGTGESCTDCARESMRRMSGRGISRDFFALSFIERFRRSGMPAESVLFLVSEKGSASEMTELVNCDEA